MKTQPTLYVGRLERYHDPQGPAAPQTSQAFREEKDPTPRNETQPQTSSNVQRRKAKTHAGLVEREAAGTPDGLRTVELQLGKPITHHRHAAESTAERTRKSASPSAMPDHEGRPGSVEAGGKPHPHWTRAPDDQPDHGVPRSPGPIGAGGPQASRGSRDSWPGRQHHRQSRDPEAVLGADPGVTPNWMEATPILGLLAPSREFLRTVRCGARSTHLAASLFSVNNGFRCTKVRSYAP
ncbi:hypothetical protein PC116_g3927 [Phytophthora cactorum]|nr:hypothetical protein Pcac1_g22897 [Phytophthora cactorum]KAG4248348.1 hypothetical protein PC116_g3927 [Phytophthora cactorum]